MSLHSMYVHCIYYICMYLEKCINAYLESSIYIICPVLSNRGVFEYLKDILGILLCALCVY